MSRRGSRVSGVRPSRVRSRRRRVADARVDRLFRLPRGDHDFSVRRAVGVPMRDGVSLLTDVYLPAGPSRGTVLVRTPYGRQTLIAALTARIYADHGYVVVNQSCRGTDGSGGEFEPFVHEVDDGADTVAWLRGQPWFDGRLALVGASYLGFAAWAIMTDPPPELVTAVVAVAAHDNHWVAHGAGAFSLEQLLSLFDAFGSRTDSLARGVLHGVTARRRLVRGYRELPVAERATSLLTGHRESFRHWLEATDPDDPWWRPMRLHAALERVDVPVLLQEGWQDRFVEQMLDAYDVLRGRGVEVGLTVGPWTHVEAATKGIGELTRDTLDWLDAHLAGSERTLRPAPVRIFVTGADEWRTLEVWPPPTAERVLHLGPGGLLGDPPPSDARPSRVRYDPADPTPTLGGRIINPALGGRRDNRTLERRPDVLLFTSDPLDEPWEVTGTPVVELVHRTDNPYADLFVRVSEVAPGGRSVDVSDGFRRLGPADANGTVAVRLDAIAHRFARGSRLRLLVSGGAHPRYARNLGTDEDPATGTRMRPSVRTVCHGEGGRSLLRLPCSLP